MKVIKNIENKYYFLPEDVDKVEEALTFKKNKSWLAKEMGFSYKTLWMKLNHKDGSYFDEMEVRKMEEILKIKLK